jgi:hypothetical protein
MSVTGITEVVESAHGEFLLEKGERKYTRKFLVLTTTPQDDSAVVLTACFAITPMGSSYACGNGTDLGAFLIHASAERVNDDYFKWMVTYEYDSIVPVPQDQGENPLLRPPLWRFGVEKYEETMTEDLNSVPIINSAGQPFETGLTMQRSRPTIQIIKNYATFDFASVAAYQDCVNDDTWFGFDPETVKCNSIEVQERNENGGTYFELTYNLSVEFNGWNPVWILDAGYYEKSAGSGSGAGAGLKLITDKFGRPLQSPALLDGNGHKNPDGAAPVYLPFIPYIGLTFTGVIP